MGILSKLVVPAPLQAAGAFLKGVPREAWYALAALALLWLAYHHGRTTAFDDCHAAAAKAQQHANELQVKREAKRDAKASAIANESHQAAAKATTKTEEATRARRAQIDAVPTTGACTAPAGLPDLAPAVDAANAARRASVPTGRYSRRAYRAMAGPGSPDHRRVGEGADGVGERHARDPHAGTPAPSG